MLSLDEMRDGSQRGKPLAEVSVVQNAQLCTRLRTIYVLLRTYCFTFEQHSLVSSHLRSWGGGWVQHRMLADTCHVSSRASSDISVKIHPGIPKADRERTRHSTSAEGYVARRVRVRGRTPSSCGSTTNYVLLL